MKSKVYFGSTAHAPEVFKHPVQFKNRGSLVAGLRQLLMLHSFDMIPFSCAKLLQKHENCENRSKTA